MKQLTFIFVFISVSLTVQAAFTFNDNCKQAYTDVLCLRFHQANSRMQTEKKLNPDNQVPFIIENYIDFLKVIIGEEEKDFIVLKENKDFR